MRNIGFFGGNVTLVITPVDGRCGYQRLAAIADAAFGINVDAGGEIVVFISKSRTSCKIICRDEKGANVVTRYLHTGRYEKLVARVSGRESEPLSLDELRLYLDGCKLSDLRG